MASYENITICNTSNFMTAKGSWVLLFLGRQFDSYPLHLSFHLASNEFNWPIRNKKKDNLLISYPGSFLRCICLRTGRSLVYWCNWNSCHRPASMLCIRQHLQKRKRQIKKKEVEKKNNTNPTRLKIAVLQLTSGLHVAVSQHGCSWNDRRQPVFAVKPLFTRFHFVARLSRHFRNWTYGSCKGYDNTQTWGEAQ